MKLFLSLMLAIGIAVSSTELYAQCKSGNCMNGRGEMIFSTGDVYKGQFRKGNMNGTGEMIFKTGDKYQGDWRDGKMHGLGTMFFATGDKYKGMWKESLIDGRGVMEWKSGEKYDGGWKNGKMHGQGVLTAKDGSRTKGKWENGVLVTAPAKGDLVVMTGVWKFFSQDSPFDTTKKPLGTMTFGADKKGVWRYTHRSSETGTTREVSEPFTWILNGSNLLLTFPNRAMTEKGPIDPDKYLYDSKNRVFNKAQEEFGPAGLVSRCQLRK